MGYMRSKFLRNLWIAVALAGGGIVFTYVQSLQKKDEFQKRSEIRQASHATYVFLEDKHKQQWIFKQITEPAPDDQMVIVLEELASDIAEQLNIPINVCKLVSSDKPFTHRIFQGFPGSLHKKVPGQCVEDIATLSDLDLHQKFRTPYMVAAKGPLAPEEIGLRRKTITSMGKHRDLPKIVALDTFIGNIDRSQPNLFYDAKNDGFYGIDMGNSLMANLPELALKRLKQAADEGVVFTKEEKEALKIYKNTLDALIQQFPPTKLIAMLENLLQIAGIQSNNTALWNEDAEQKLAKWNRQIRQNYNHTILLTEYLQTII